MEEFKIQYVNVNSVVPYENNPRINDRAVEFVANSIRKFGFGQPISVDKDNVIICGHTRVLAAKQLGIKTIPVIVRDDLNEGQVKAYRIADNSTASVAEWDFDKLDIELQDIEFDMDQFGLSFETNIEDDDIDDNPQDSQTNNRNGGELPDQKVIKYKKTMIPYNDDEEYALDGLIAKYVANNGTVIGFVDWLSKKVK